DGSASIFYIDQYVSAVSNIYEEGIYDPDYAYFSHHMNGPTNYHHFAMNSFDSRDFTVGFFVDDRLLASGEWYIYTKTSRTDIYIGSNSRMEQGYFDMPAYPTH
ncbi:MAG: hypothetical protein J6I98_02105, partial [Clostridia bacterium]|nr:hypothetical protein [Clostridia bacterium]